MDQTSALMKQLDDILAAHGALFIAVRTTLEMAEPVDDEGAIIHPEVLADLQEAYMIVYRTRQGSGGGS